MFKVIIADPIHPDAVSFLHESKFTIIDVSKNKSDLGKVLKNADALVVRGATKINSDFLDQAPNLKIIARSGVGLDNIDLETCKIKQIQVVNSPEGPTLSVAELTLGLMIMVARKFGIVYSGTKLGNWPKKEKGIELNGKTLGIIGSGAIGGTFAKYSLAIGMNVIAFDIIQYEELSKLKNFNYVTLDQLIKNSDVISIHVPLIPATKHMINSESFSKMKKGVMIINTSRGGIIDEEALNQAITEGKVGGVGLDVYEKEPVDSRQELIQHPLVITTPHIGAQTSEASMKNSIIAIQKLIAFFTN